MIPNPAEEVASEIKVVCKTSSHLMRVTSFDVATGDLVERCSRCGHVRARKAFFSTETARARGGGKIGDKVGRDAARRFAGKMKGQSKRVGQHPATRKR